MSNRAWIARRRKRDLRRDLNRALQQVRHDPWTPAVWNDRVLVLSPQLAAELRAMPGQEAAERA